MNELIIPVGILALLTTTVAVAAFISDYVGKVGACRIMEAERGSKRQQK